ncbi:MAG: class I SAM-dependent methyltransferase [bacterium]|nr:class I SAM-dependent methyltransferase [bacterium]
MNNNVDSPVNYQSRNYLSFKRWAGYFLQFDLIRSLNVKNILEIGPGNHILRNILNAAGIESRTLDNNSEIKPDLIGDIRYIDQLGLKGKFECIAAFEVLEHISWDELPSVVQQIYDTTSNWAVISVPYAGMSLFSNIRIGRRGMREYTIGFRVPGFWRSNKYYSKSGHLWECGAKGYSRKKVRDLFKDYFSITKEAFHPLDRSQIFWILKKNDNNQQ